MFRKICKILLGVGLIPFAVSFSISFYEEIGKVHLYSKNQSLFLSGLVIYLVIHTLFFKPKYLYVFGHELTHAIATWVAGGRIFGFKVSREGGSIRTDKSNLLIALAPYLFPFYAIVISVLYFLISLFKDVRQLTSGFIFLVGFALSFHIVMTVEFLKIKQSDITKSGYIFSIIFIYLVNLSLISLILGWIFPDFLLGVIYKSSFNNAINFYQAIFSRLFL